MEDALEWVESPTRLQALPLEEFKELYTDLAPEEIVKLNKTLSRERELLKPLLWRWRTMPPSKEKDRLIELWRESWTRALTGAAAAAAAGAGDIEMVQELAGDMEAAQELAGVT